MDFTSCRIHWGYHRLWLSDPSNRYALPRIPGLHPADNTQASGLYYLSELVEEHTVLARKLLTRLIYAIISAQILLVLVDRFPVWLSLLSSASHGVYLGNLRHFPIVKLSDPVFIMSCGTPHSQPPLETPVFSVERRGWERL